MVIMDKMIGFVHITSMKTIFDVDKTDKTVCCVLVDKKIGSAGASSMHHVLKIL